MIKNKTLEAKIDCILSPQPTYTEYSGYKLDDILLLEKYINKGSISGKENFVTDFLGIRHVLNVFSEHYKSLSGSEKNKLPMPNDGIHTETIEYVSCFMSVENAAFPIRCLNWARLGPLDVNCRCCREKEGS